MKLSEEQKNWILYQCVNTRKRFKKIAEDSNTSLEQVYEIFSAYCNDNGYKNFKRGKDRLIFEQYVKYESNIKKKNKNLMNAKEIEEWTEQHGRIPRQRIKGVKTTSNREEETEEQKELRLGHALHNIKPQIMKKYEGKSLEEIEDEEDREIVRITRRIDEKNNRKKKNKSLMNAREIEEWAEQHGRKPRQIIQGVKTTSNREEETEEQKELRLGYALNNIKTQIMKKYEGKSLEEIEDEEDREIVRITRRIDEKNNRKKKNKSLMNAREIEEWAEQHGRIPRQRIKEVKTTSNREEETEEQKELRIGHALNNIKTQIMKKYEGKSLEEIEDEEDREIVRITRRIDEKNNRKKKNKSLMNAREIEEWAEQHGRKPRQIIQGVKTTSNREEETEEQKEVRLGHALNNIKTQIMKKYERKSLEEIEDEEDKEIVRITRRLYGKYKNNRKKENKSLMNAREIEEWAEQHGRKPRQIIQGVKTTSNREEETEEQKELRIGHALNNIKTQIMKKYEGKSLEEIEDEEDREIVRITRRLYGKYKNNRNNHRNKETMIREEDRDINTEFCKALLNLFKTKNATVEQIRIIANCYGVDLEKVEYYLKQEDSLKEGEER